MVPQWFIEEKRDGKTHSSDALRDWIVGVTNGPYPIIKSLHG